MADTNLAKKANGYNYKYTELAQINEYVESIGGSYYQYIESTDSGVDYIVTVKVDKDGKESKPLRGSRIIDTKTLQGKSNPAQELGSGITYARRYSLLMAYGLATEDNDAANLTQTQKAQQPRQTAEHMAAPDRVTDSTVGQIQYMCKDKSILPSELCKYYGVSSLTELTVAQGTDCLKRLEATKKRA